MLIRIVLVGLSALVPSSDGKEMCVVLVDARTPIVVEGEWVEAHHPVVRVAKTVVVSDAGLRAPDIIADGAAFFYLEDEQLEFKPVGSTHVKLDVLRLGSEQKPNPRRPCCDDPAECSGMHKCEGFPDAAKFEDQTRDYGWVIRLADVVAGSENLAGDCFEASTPPSTVVARFKLPAGVLSSYLLEGEPSPSNRVTDKICVVDFDDLPAYYERSATRRLILEIKVSQGPELEIGSKNFSGSDLKPIKLKTGAPVLEVLVMNSPLSELRDPDSTSYGRGYHFAHYYRLSKTPVDPSQWRLPFCLGFAGDLLCPPVEMEE